MKYTYEELKALNLSYDQDHCVTKADVEKVNKLVALIEASRKETPTDGDMVICISPEKGIVSGEGHIESGWTTDLSICTDPYIPFIEADLHTHASGGYWIDVSQDDCKRFQKVYIVWKLFQTWGHNGPEANGAVRFYATVPYWKFSDPRFY